MSLENMEALEVRVRRLVNLVQELKQTNEGLKDDLQQATERLAKQSELFSDWEEERGDIRKRIETVLGDLDFLECSDEVAGGIGDKS
ncbi:MAG: cell division protein ZapB [Nitrospirales bacterium]|nr:cell division protein ZapB [Nitrospirales bacterium]